jgi:hypothetical protein
MTMSKETIEPNKKGQKPITFNKGGEHKTLGVALGKKIPAKKEAAAAAGKLGPKAKKQEQFRRNVLTGGKKRGTSDGYMS